MPAPDETSRSPRPSGRTAAETPPTAAPVPASSSRARLDECIARLRAASPAFAALSLDDRIQLLRDLRAGYARATTRLVEAACRAKGITPGTPLEAEEWALGPWPVLRQMRLLLDMLSALRRRRALPLGELGRTVDGRLSVQVFPQSTLDTLLFPGMSAEIHARAGVSESDLLGAQARFYRQGGHTGRVVLILGARNAASAPIQDALTRLFNEGKVCIVKPHPVNAHLGPLLEEAFAAAVRRHFLHVVYGGADEGGFLAQHPWVDEIHLGGSPETHEQIIWGTGAAERAERKPARHPLHRKPVTSELGCVSPVLVVPGPYLDRQLAFQAQALAGAMVQNAGFGGHTPRLLVTPSGWAQRDAFLRHLEDALALAPLRRCSCPGALEQWVRLTEGRRGIRTIGPRTADRLPWTIAPGLDPGDRRERLFTRDSFAPILGDVALGSTDPLEFLQEAVGFVNERVWGTLSATLIVHPRTQSDPRLTGAVERAIAQLRYGTVGVNVWPGIGYVLGLVPWGGHPSSGLDDVQSGRGWSHNTLMVGDIEKVVLRQALTLQLKPAYVPGHRSADTLLRRLTAVERGAGWAGLPGVLEAAIRG